ncbi:MAG: hypothetical protein WBX25_18095 [Rhodomicrobium sp.]
MRRRLTVLDRALSDDEAGALERITSCINSLSNVSCLDYLKSEVRSSPFGRLPFGERKRREIAAMTLILKALNPSDKYAIIGLAVLLDPSRSSADFKSSEQFVARVTAAAKAVVLLYEQWSRLQGKEKRAAGNYPSGSVVRFVD